MTTKSSSRPLYDVLGVAHTASMSDIARAYRRLALQFHPDRNPDGVEKFKQLSNAYAILSDAEKRGVYDLTGVVPGSPEDPHSSGAEDGRSMQERSSDIKHQMAAFFRTYRGSAEEEADFVKSFTNTDGNFRKMVRAHLVFDNGVKGEVQRLHELGQRLIAKGTLRATPLWERATTPKGLAKVELAMSKEREEADEVLKEMGLDEEAQRRAKEASANADLGALQALMQQRQQHSWQSMMASLEAKYVDPEKEKRRAAKAKDGSRPAKTRRVER